MDWISEVLSHLPRVQGSLIELNCASTPPPLVLLLHPKGHTKGSGMIDRLTRSAGSKRRRPSRRAPQYYAPASRAVNSGMPGCGSWSSGISAPPSDISCSAGVFRSPPSTATDEGSEAGLQSEGSRLRSRLLDRGAPAPSPPLVGLYGYLWLRWICCHACMLKAVVSNQGA